MNFKKHNHLQYKYPVMLVLACMCMFIARPFALCNTSVLGYATCNNTIIIYAGIFLYMPMLPAFGACAGISAKPKIIVPGIASLNYFRIFNRWGVYIFPVTNISSLQETLHKNQPQWFDCQGYMAGAVTKEV